MTTARRIDKNLDDLILNLKLTKPYIPDVFKKQAQTEPRAQINPIQQLPTADDAGIVPSFNMNCFQSSEAPITQPYLPKHPDPPLASAYSSVVNDTYDDFMNYSFYQLKSSQANMNPSASSSLVPLQQFSFCNQQTLHTDQDGDDDDDSLDVNRFSSIVDKLKTEGDQQGCYYGDGSESEFLFYSKEQDHCGGMYSSSGNGLSHQFSSRNLQRRHTEYFSGEVLKSTQKTYRTLAKRTATLDQSNQYKPLKQPIYAKLTLPHHPPLDKQKQNSHPNTYPTTLHTPKPASIITSLTTKKSTYSSSTSSSIMKRTLPSSKTKTKQLSEKIRRQNQIVYQSEIKESKVEMSPMLCFKKAGIQPYKFSTYKARLFG